MSFSIKLRTNDFVKTNSVFGPIWIDVNNHNFPGLGWQDFPVIILGCWLKEIQSLIANSNLIGECLFMDGPYKFDVKAQNQTKWILTFIRRGKLEESLMETEINPKSFLSELSSVTKIVIDLCQEKGWQSRDLSILEKEYKSIKKVL